MGGEYDAKKRNDETSYFVSVTALTILYNQLFKKVKSYPLIHSLSNNSIKNLLLKDINKKERIRLELEIHQTKKEKTRRTNKSMQTNSPSPRTFAMLTSLILGKVHYGFLNTATYFYLIKKEHADR